jgi:hypothetical protein
MSNEHGLSGSAEFVVSSNTINLPIFLRQRSLLDALPRENQGIDA